MDGFWIMIGLILIGMGIQNGLFEIAKALRSVAYENRNNR